MQQEDFLAKQAGGTEGPPTFHRLGPGNVRGLQAPMNAQGAICQARGKRGLRPSLGKGLCQHGVGEGWKITLSLVASTSETTCQASR